VTRETTLILIVGMSGGTALAGPVAYERKPGSSTPQVGSPTSNDGLQTFADNFALGADASINHVRWWGFSEKSGPTFDTDLSNFSAFKIAFFEDAGSAGTLDGVGAPISDFEISLGDAALSTSVVGSGVDQIVRFDAVLPSFVDLDGGSDLWISIRAVLIDDDLGKRRFAWQAWDGTGDGTPGDDDFSFHAGDDQWTFLENGGTDTTFVLSVVPLPAPWLLGACGIGVLSMRRRR